MTITQQHTANPVPAEPAQRGGIMPPPARVSIEYRKLIEGRVAAKYRVTAECAARVDEFLAQSAYLFEAHGNSQSVIIWGEVDEQAYAERIRDHGAQPITERVFPSARAASTHFGYIWDAVGQALGRAKRRGQEVAEVGGVPVRWMDETPGLD